MSSDGRLEQGWLRTQIQTALHQIAEAPYLSQEQKSRASQTATDVGSTDRLKYSTQSSQLRQKIA